MDKNKKNSVCSENIDIPSCDCDISLNKTYEFTVNTKTNDAFLDGVLVGKFIDGRLIRNNK